MDHSLFLQSLRRQGHRLTPQREMVLSVICQSRGHINADEILKRIRKRYPYINKSAVYRTLDLLARLNLVHLTDLGQGCMEYEIHAHPHHHHLLCRKCGRMTEADESIFAPLDKALREDYGFAADLDHFAIFGLCKRCSRENNPGRRANRKVSVDAHP